MMSRERPLGIAIGVAVTTSLIALLALVQPTGETAPSRTLVRQVDIGAAPPPPPPLPPAAREPSPPAAAINLSDEVSSPLALLSADSIEQTFTVERLQKPEFALESPTLARDLSVNWAEFGLDQLDQLPRLISDLTVRFPRELVDRGVVRFAVELSVMIDESGAVFLRRVVKNPHPEMDAEIQRVVRRARFTTPTKDGAPVRAAFIWPLVFEDP